MERWVDLNDLVDAAMIAERLGYKNPESVHVLWRRHPDFPKPLTKFGRLRIWSWNEVKAWATSTGRLA